MPNNNHLERARRVMAEAQQHFETARVAAERALRDLRTAIFELEHAYTEITDDPDKA